MRREIGPTRAIRGQLRSHGPDERIAALANAQAGVVGRRQLIGAGIDADRIDRRIGAGRLHIVHRGVYAVGHPRISREGRWHAALLAAGDGAALSHRAAAAVWEMQLDAGPRIDVIAPRDRTGDRGLRIHRIQLEADERTTRHGLPLTTPVRTLIDLAAGRATQAELERALRQALYQRLLEPSSLPACLCRYEGRRGMKSLRALVERVAEAPGITRSRLEERFLAFLRRQRLPQPELNAGLDVGGIRIEVDCLWRDQRVIAELDGRQGHETPFAFEADRARDRALAAAGWTVIRITWRSLRSDRAVLAEQLRALVPAS